MGYAKDKDSMLRVRLPAEQKAMTEALAKARDVSGAEIVRRALDSYVAKSGGAPSPAERDYIISKAGPLAEEQVNAIVRGLEQLNERLAAVERHFERGGALT